MNEPMLPGSWYCLLQFYPDNTRDEHINVGVIGADATGVRSRLLSAAGWERVAAFVGGGCGHARDYAEGIAARATDETELRYCVEHLGRGVYTTVAVKQQGSSVEGTDTGLDRFFDHFCALAEGKKP
jgi:hypothetical protein